MHQLLENYAKAYTREKQAEKERKLAAQADGEEPPAPSGSSKKRRKTEKKTVPVPQPASDAAAKGIALGAAVAAKHPPLKDSPGSRKRRRASNLTVKVGDDVRNVRSPPVSAPESTEGAPVGVPIQAEGLEGCEDGTLDSAGSTGSNTFWQSNGEEDAGGELPIASHFSPITPFLPVTSSSENDRGDKTASGLAIADERPTSAAEDVVPPSPFAFLWSPAVGAVRWHCNKSVSEFRRSSPQTACIRISGTGEYSVSSHEQSAAHCWLHSAHCRGCLAITQPGQVHQIFFFQVFRIYLPALFLVGTAGKGRTAGQRGNEARW